MGNPLITDFRSRIRKHWLMPRFSSQGALHSNGRQQLVIAPTGLVAPLMPVPQFGIIWGHRRGNPHQHSVSNHKNHSGDYRYRLWWHLHPQHARRRCRLAFPHGVGASWAGRVVVHDQAGTTPLEGRHPIGPTVVFRWSWHGPKRRTRAAGGRGHGHA